MTAAAAPSGLIMLYECINVTAGWRRQREMDLSFARHPVRVVYHAREKC